MPELTMEKSIDVEENEIKSKCLCPPLINDKSKIVENNAYLIVQIGIARDASVLNPKFNYIDCFYFGFFEQIRRYTSWLRMFTTTRVP